MGLFDKIIRHRPSAERQQHVDTGSSSRPGHQGEENQQSKEPAYAPPPGPPPSYQQTTHDGPDEYNPPPGPPPSQLQSQAISGGEQYLPPPGPPPSSSEKQQSTDETLPRYHDWQTAVPDTALLPPPPAAANVYSPTSNADSSQAERARDWCAANPLRPAGRPHQQHTSASRNGGVKLLSPGRSTHSTLSELGRGSWSGVTTARAADLCFTTDLPLYYALAAESPKLSGRSVAAYFEVHVNRLGAPDRDGNLASLAIGFVAPPYPTWRMPGWERGSLAVHSDDGNRYVNNQDGGLDFVPPFGAGEVVGVGVRYWSEGWGGGSSNTLKGEVFFTRNGQVERTWSLQEEIDADDQLGNFGVEGDYDLYAAIGTYGEVGFKAVFNPKGWAFEPKQDQIPGL